MHCKKKKYDKYIGLTFYSSLASFYFYFSPRDAGPKRKQYIRPTHYIKHRPNMSTPNQAHSSAPQSLIAEK